MLVLTRKIGEKIIIDHNVKITVLSANGTHFRIGIDAPKEVAVHREEVYERLKTDEEENQQQ